MESDEELFRASQEIKAEYDVGQFVFAAGNEDERFLVSSADDLTDRAELPVPETTTRRDKWARGVFTAVSRNNGHSQKELAKFMHIFTG